MPTGFSTEPLSPEAELARTRRRIPKFRGVIFQNDAWWTQLRQNGKWKIIGGPWQTAAQAWSHYKASRRVRVNKAESAERVETLLRAAESFPVEFEVQQSLHGSSMNLHAENWQRALLVDHHEAGYEARKKP